MTQHQNDFELEGQTEKQNKWNPLGIIFLASGSKTSLTGYRRITLPKVSNLRKGYSTNERGTTSGIKKDLHDSLDITDMDVFIEAYYELYHERPPTFLDEVQNTESWHLKVRHLIDQNYKVFITGSKANLLSSEIATHLAGRTFIKRMLPFSFREYLRLKQIPCSSDSIYGKERFLIKNGFQEFLSYGGFPEVIKMGLKKELLRQYFEIVFYKDIIVRHNIRHETALRLLIQKLIENLGKSYNVNNLRDRISQILSISKQSLFDYLNFLEESFFVVHINNYTH